ncbi:MAG: TMEM165/GDT1 family protein [Porticoccaceae bacterium]
METFLLSTGIVALAEIGDKTQLLALLLAAKFRKPAPIILGILVATLANHALAGALGAWITTAVSQETMRWILGLSFMAMALWALHPDKIGDDDQKYARYGAFASTVVVFFLAEIGDKTQVATVALAAQHSSLGAVIMGTTLGMMIANVPAVYLGERVVTRISAKYVRIAAALMFFVIGILTLAGIGDRLGF